MVKCVGVGCRSGCMGCPGVGEDGEKISFHSFPIGNPELCEKWVRAGCRKNFIPSRHSKLCSLHFLPTDFLQEWRDTNVSRQKKKVTLCEKRKRRHLKDDAIPSVFPNTPTFTYLSKTKVAPRITSRATMSRKYSEEEKMLESLKQASLEIDNSSRLALTEVEKQPRAVDKSEMVHKCSGFGCRSGYHDCPGVGEDGEKITFHAYPIRNPELCEVWVRANPRKDFIPTKHSKLCSLHFQPSDFIQEWHDTNVARQRKNAALSDKPKRRFLKDNAVPSVFFNAPAYLSKTQAAPTVHLTSRATSSNRLQEEVKRLESLELSFLENDDISSLTLTEVEERLRGQKCDIPSKTTVQTTVRDEHFMNIAETLLKYREHGFLCDAVLVAKCGRELKAHSALLAAVSPVFLMAIEEKPSSGPYHLCFPEVELEVLEIAVHFIYTGKLLLPTVYSHTDQLSVLFNKLSDLGLSLHKLHECERTFVRSAKQPPNSLKSIKAEDSGNETSLKDSVQKLQTSCDERPLDKKPSSADTFNEVMMVDVAPNDVRTSQTRGESEESSRSILAKQKGQENRKEERQKRKDRNTGNQNGKKERMPANAQVSTGTVVTKPVKRPAFSIPKALLGDLSTPVAALHFPGTDSWELNNQQVGLLEQNIGKINTLDSDSHGIHEAIVNNSAAPNPKTHVGILKRVDPPPTERPLGSSGETLAEKASINNSQAHTCEHCKDPNAETFTNETELLWHEIKHHWDQCNVCNYCGCKLSSKKSLKDHIKRHLGIFPRPIKNHKCNDCGLHFMTPTQLKNHRVRHTGEKPHECPDCRKRFTLRENMERHKLLHTGYPFLCDFCGKGFTRKSGLLNHVTLHHEFECALCSCKQTSKADMEKHALEVHQLSQSYKFNSIIKNPRTYLCDLCGKNCISAYSLRSHLRGRCNRNLQTSKAPLKGQAQGPSLLTSAGHGKNRVHTGERPFVCNVCQKGFNHKSVLMMHLTIHSGFKPFDCAVCSKSFASKGHLKQHIKQHAMTDIDRKPFKCGICNNQFTSKSSLMVHHRIHTGEKPYKCRICSKQFICKSTLTIHIRTHTGDKPFTCTVCEMTFAQSQHLGRHMRTHTGEKPFVCEFCCKSYKHKIDLRYHLTRFHKNDVTLQSLSVNIEIDRKVKAPDALATNVCILDELKPELDN